MAEETYYAKNRDRILAQQKEYRRDPEVRARDLARQRQRRRESPAARLAHRKRVRRWQAKNVEKVREAQAAYRAKGRDFVRGFKVACIRCGENHPACLDFHHRDPAEKENSMSRLIAKGAKFDRLKAEIDKCDVLCANCHRKHHWVEANG